MAIKDVFKDVLKHTHSLGIFEMVKITGTLDKTEIETVDADKTVIFKGETHNAVPDFVDSTIGLSRMGVLQGYLQYPGFDDENAKQEVVTQDRNGDSVPKRDFFSTILENVSNQSHRLFWRENMCSSSDVLL